MIIFKGEPCKFTFFKWSQVNYFGISDGIDGFSFVNVAGEASQRLNVFNKYTNNLAAYMHAQGYFVVFGIARWLMGDEDKWKFGGYVVFQFLKERLPLLISFQNL
jgi:hypothetical protein